ncbi:type IV toxin-antitoxin system AbiEi family antitoxin domain-containing protein [Microbacterium sp. P05]|uniref:type IV toxin-antitoxin system AbiEi family antitoxin domain-containing protein n=1 Tax=Microbacterium sp. P05 TaxID=3366948 RepID=UPI0037457D3E
MLSPVELVRSHGGVARTALLFESGCSRRSVGTAIADGTLLRLRRGWVGVPDADPFLAAAARAGVVLTCVTQARRLGL